MFGYRESRRIADGIHSERRILWCTVFHKIQYVVGNLWMRPSDRLIILSRTAWQRIAVRLAYGE